MTLAENWLFGDTTITNSDRAYRWATRHQQKRVVRLPKTKPRNMKSKPANSRYEWGSLGGQLAHPPRPATATTRCWPMEA